MNLLDLLAFTCGHRPLGGHVGRIASGSGAPYTKRSKRFKQIKEILMEYHNRADAGIEAFKTETETNGVDQMDNPEEGTQSMAASDCGRMSPVKIPRGSAGREKSGV